MRKLPTAVAAALALGVFTTAPAAQAASVIAESHFDSGSDGWRNGDFTVGNTTYDVTWQAGGFISVGDDHGQFSAFLAPAAFLGDRRDAIGGVLAFDLASDFPPL